MTLGIFVVGPSDRATIPILIKKLGYKPPIYPRWVRGNMLDFTEMSNQIDTLLSIQTHVRRIFIFIDSEGADPQETLRSTEPISAQLNRVKTRIPVTYIVVDHALEGWLACDEEALRAVLGRNAKIRIKGNPEDHPRPAELLERVFRQNGKQFQKTVHCQQIAEYVTPQNIAEKSPTFRRLVQLL